ncbi:MAG TPA: hypothetical protein VJR30_08885 [Bradyrhizobium sp.]|nr:hypothetical protein [Bradyrhizobium sp.]
MAGTSPAMMRVGRPYSHMPHSFIIFVDRIFTSFVEGAFTSIFDASAEIAAIPCLYRAGHAD